ncbi:hypothetical protein HYDPIDRAFT_112762 [Hydnomerulius pinastri MD-312]|uniref:Oxidoreductase-like domain-containing protein n=1 Tax=Hydnomerulius pinastri MD-312 TaxID=994086 RepID=A0A0C9WEB4_9AGAM|nr:hypothetical protein HYDPIDRAFT_112762 [Hydnomerulius pinastri MD-312]
MLSSSLPSATCRSLHHWQHQCFRFASTNAPSPSLSSAAIARLKRPNRGGQNLTERYRRLENTTRGKEAFTKQVSAFAQESASAAELRSTSKPATPGSSKSANTIAGFAIPEEPRPPADDECCMSGCAICVYDLYEDSLSAYKESVSALRSSLSALSIPESEWPAHIRTTKSAETPAAVTPDKRKDAVLSAFEEMERTLKEKRERRAAVEAES